MLKGENTVTKQKTEVEFKITKILLTLDSLLVAQQLLSLQFRCKVPLK